MVQHDGWGRGVIPELVPELLQFEVPSCLDLFADQHVTVGDIAHYFVFCFGLGVAVRTTEQLRCIPHAGV